MCFFVVVQSPSHVRVFVTPWTAAHQASLSLTICWNFPKFMSITLVMPSSHLIFWCPLLLPSIFPSIQDFSSEAAIRIRWPKYWSFSFSISPSNEHSGLISLKIDWFGLLAVQGTLRNLLQHHSSQASNFWLSAFFTACLSQPYMTTWKTIALTVWTFVNRVMSLLFNTLSRFVIDFLPRNKDLLISWLQSPSAVILEPKKRKSVTTSTFSLSICLEIIRQYISLILNCQQMILLMIFVVNAMQWFSFGEKSSFLKNNWCFLIVQSSKMREKGLFVRSQILNA